MVAHNAFPYKWVLNGIATLFCMALQGMFLHRLRFWGVLPFLYPLLAAIPATFESPAPAAAFGLVLGTVCDLLLPDTFPCFYTLLFPLTGLCAALIARLIPAGMRCSFTASATAFFLHGFFHCFIVWSGGENLWRAGMFLTLREFVVTAPVFIPLLTFLYGTISSRTRADERRNTIYRR